MSLFRRTLGLDRPAARGPAPDPDAPLPAASPADTRSVRELVGRLAVLPPARARFTAAFAYLLGRAANATLGTSGREREAMLRILTAGGLDGDTAALVTDLAAGLAGEFGATEDFLVAREFKGLSTPDDRRRLLRCCFLVMAADDEVDATESWLANRLAEELDVERPDLNAIRAEFHEQLSGVRALRAFREEDR